MLKMFVEAARKELEYRCDGKGKEEYLKLTPCLVEKSGPALHKCNVRYSGYLQAITEQNKTDRIPFACWSVNINSCLFLFANYWLRNSALSNVFSWYT